MVRVLGPGKRQPTAENFEHNMQCGSGVQSPMGHPILDEGAIHMACQNKQIRSTKQPSTEHPNSNLPAMQMPCQDLQTTPIEQSPTRRPTVDKSATYMSGQNMPIRPAEQPPSEHPILNRATQMPCQWPSDFTESRPVRIQQSCQERIDELKAELAKKINEYENQALRTQEEPQSGVLQDEKPAKVTTSRSQQNADSWERHPSGGNRPTYALMSSVMAVFAVLHFVRPNWDFGDNVPILFWPLSPIRIVVLLSIIHTLYLWPMVRNSELMGTPDPRVIKFLQRIGADNAYHVNAIEFTGAAVLTVDILLLYFKWVLIGLYDTLPPYMAGDLKVEGTWLASALAILVILLYLLVIVFAFLWIPVVVIWHNSRQIGKPAIDNSSASTTSAQYDNSNHTTPITPVAREHIDLPCQPIVETLPSPAEPTATTTIFSPSMDSSTNAPSSPSEPQISTLIDSMGQTIQEIKDHHQKFAKNVEDLQTQYADMTDCEDWGTWKEMYEMTREMLGDGMFEGGEMKEEC